MFDRTGVKVTSSGLVCSWTTIRNMYSFRRSLYKITRGGAGASHGYLAVRVNKKCVLVHRVIARLFLGEPDKGCMVNHKNGVKTDNRPANLEWVSQADNNRHATYKLKVNRRKPQFDHAEALELVAAGFTQKFVAEVFNVSPSAIFRIVHKGESSV